MAYGFYIHTALLWIWEIPGIKFTNFARIMKFYGESNSLI